MVSFVLFWPLSRQFGHAWWINLGITVFIDTVAYIFHKEWVWTQRQISLTRSAVLSYTFTGTTFVINLWLAWRLLHWNMLNNTVFGNAPTKVMMGALGIVVNPLVFLFRDKVSLRDSRPKAESA